GDSADQLAHFAHLVARPEQFAVRTPADVRTREIRVRRRVVRSRLSRPLHACSSARRMPRRKKFGEDGEKRGVWANGGAGCSAAMLPAAEQNYLLWVAGVSFGVRGGQTAKHG